MFRKILFWGTVAGLIVGSVLFGTTVAMAGDPPSPGVGMALGYTSMLIALTAIFMGVKRHRDEALGGVIRFWPAFGMGLGISFVASVCYVLAWEAALAVTGMDFGAEMARHMIEQRRAEGAGTAELARLAAEMEAFAVRYADPLFRVPMTFAEILPVGVLVSLVSAALLRRPAFLPVARA